MVALANIDFGCITILTAGMLDEVSEYDEEIDMDNEYSSDSSHVMILSVVKIDEIISEMLEQIK